MNTAAIAPVGTGRYKTGVLLSLLLPLLAGLALAGEPLDEFARLLPLPIERGTAERLLARHLGREPTSSHTLRLDDLPAIAVYRLGARRSLVLEFATTHDPAGNIGLSDSATALRMADLGDAVAGFAEPLRSDILLVQDAPVIQSGGFRGDLLLGTAIRLQRLGRERALAALDGYLGLFRRQQADDSIASARAAHRWAFVCDWDGERVHLLARLLFRPRTGGPGWQPPGLGAPAPVPTDHTALPLFPLAVRDGLPFLAVAGYCLAGQPEPPESAVDFARTACDLAAELPVPDQDPLLIADRAVSDAGLLGAYAASNRQTLASLLRQQAIGIRSALLPGSDPGYHACSSHQDEDAQRWRIALTQATAAPLRWDATATGYAPGR